MTVPLASDDRGSQPIRSQNVRIARISRSASQEELATATNIAQYRLSRIEQGLFPASRAEIASISAALDYPISFFSMEIHEQGAVAGVFHRKRSSTSTKLVNRVTSLLSIQNTRTARLLEVVDIESERSVQTLDPGRLDCSAADVAREVRRVWGVPPGPIHDLTALVESAGVVVFKVPFESPEVSGVSQWITGRHPIIVINASMPPDRYRWTLAHELGHLFMHAGVYCADRDIERDADEFTSEFLTPHAELEAAMPTSVRLDSLASLKLYWRVSIASLITAAWKIGKISVRQRQYLMMGMSRNGWRTREPAEIPSEGPQLARLMVDEFLSVPGNALEQLTEALCISSGDLRMWFQGDSGGLKLVR